MTYVDAFLQLFTFGERAGGLANLVQIAGAVLAILSAAYGLVRYGRHRQRRYQRNLEELVAEQARKITQLELENDTLVLKTPAGWLDASEKVQRLTKDDGQAFLVLQTSLLKATPTLNDIFLRLAEFCSSLILTEDSQRPAREAKRYAGIAALLGPTSARTSRLLEELDTLASRASVRHGEEPETGIDAVALATKWAGEIADTQSLVERLTTLASDNINADIPSVAERLAWRARAIAMKRLQPTDWLTLSARYHWAKALVGCGQSGSAASELEDLVPLMSSAHGSAGDPTLATRALRAYANNQIGKTAAALAEITAVVPLRRAVSGDDDPGTLSNRHTLGVVLEATDQLEEARVEMESLATDEIRVKGKRSPDALATRQVLAVILSRLRQDSRATELFKSTMTEMGKICGTTAPITLTTRRLMATHHLNMGRISRGVNELERLRPLANRFLGPSHPETANIDRILREIRTAGYSVGATWTMFNRPKSDDESSSPSGT